VRSTSAWPSVLTFRSPCFASLTGGYSLLSVALGGPLPSSPDSSETPLSFSGVSGVNPLPLVTVLRLHCDACALVILARFGAGSAAHLFAASSDVLGPVPAIDPK
jgi:hypothetical protein